MLPFLMLFVAPLFQVILSARRISGRTTMSLMNITGYALAIGTALSIAATYIVAEDTRNPSGPSCGVISGAFCIIGLLITMVSVPVIGLISYLIFRTNKQPEQ